MGFQHLLGRCCRFFVWAAFAVAALPTHASLVVAGESGSAGNLFQYTLAGTRLPNFNIGGPALDGPAAAKVGPDGRLYVLSGGDTVYRYDGVTGAYIDTFLPTNTAGLEEGKDLAFGPDGNLYIAANCSLNPPANDSICTAFQGEGGRVMRFNRTTGAFMGNFIANAAGAVSGTGRLSEAMALAFGPDGNLYVGNDARSLNSGTDAYNVLRFNATTGAFVSVFVPDNDQGLYDPNTLVFGPDGNLYIAWEDCRTTVTVNLYCSGVVSRYNPTTGAFLGYFVPAGNNGLSEAQGMAFGPDGHLYVGSGDTGEVFRFNGQTGAFLNVVVTSPAGGLGDPKALLFVADPVVQPVPGLGTWAVILLSILLVAMAWTQIQRRNRHDA